MTRQTLFEIADVLRPYLMRKDTVMRSAVPVEERVAIGVYFLASRSCYRTISLVFQKGTSTIASVIVEVCLAIEHTVLKEEVRVVDFNKGKMTDQARISQGLLSTSQLKKEDILVQNETASDYYHASE
ncbi:hypothetical protein JRQ81_001703 [Phrynocephalus forsythii]|uniref:Uncharacterized protein n=1 Tax=Phrynocephalus forsythii TaxID=171643 RepID=A0A9Q1B848_9SAUR|nr:hypothetical protein JRQ81_001703 [Phrynocephalus forsythii]